ncbi:MAG: EAL domain-containing protein [Planctomycetes bacterium]|nr:EAL domain-containing protein [Planctomycetota bacterium]
MPADIKKLTESKSVLLVEDDELLLTNLTYFFQVAGFQVAVARDGTEGLESIAEAKPDLVVTDISMPRMDGLTFILHAKLAIPSVPFLISSAFDDSQNYRRALQLGVNDFFAKPWDIEELIARAIELTEGQEGPALASRDPLGDALRDGIASMDALVAVAVPDAFASVEGFIDWACGHLEDRSVEGSQIFPSSGKEIYCLLQMDHDAALGEDLESRIESLLDGFRVSMAEFVGQPIGLLRTFVVSGDAIRADVDEGSVKETAKVIELLHEKERSKPAALRNICHDLRAAKQLFDLPVKLSKALKESPEQLSVYWQPKVRLIDGVMVGAEALARWEPSSGDFVRPDEFIQAAKDWGFLRSLSYLLRELSLKSAQDLLELMPAGGRLSLNVEPTEILERSVSEDFVQQVRDAGLTPDCFILEITETESIPAEARREFLGELNRLSICGFALSIDDFGQGASAIQQVIDWPINELKIDRSMTMRVEASEVQAAFLASTGMANALGVPVVAEGVEDEGQVALLRDLGVEIGQGYFWSKPLPAEDLRDWHSAAK